MADELAKLRCENNELKAKLEEAVGQNTNLKDQNSKLNDENAELKKAQINEDNNKKFMPENLTQSGSSVDSISTLTPNKRSNEESNALVAKMKAKRPKLFDNCVPNWLVEVLAWIKRMEMADSFLPTSCRTFNQLCFPKLHGKNVKPHSAGPFTFSHHLDKWGNIHANIKHSKYAFIDDANNAHCDYPFGFPIPIPCVPPPDYIQSISYITFEFLNGELVEFIKGVLHLMENTKILVNKEMLNLNAGDKYVALMNRLFDMLRNKILEIKFYYPIINFCRLFNDFLNEVPTLDIDADIETEKEIAFLVDWLATTWSNGQAKEKLLLISDFFKKEFERDFVDRIIEQFTNASQTQNYYVSYLSNNQIPDEFTLANKQTQEVLALHHSHSTHPTIGLCSKFLVRYSKGEEEEKCRERPSNKIFLEIKKFAI